MALKDSLSNPDTDSDTAASVDSMLLPTIKQIVLKKDYARLEPFIMNFVKENLVSDNTTEAANVMSPVWQCLNYLTKPTINLSDYAQSITMHILEYLLEISRNSLALMHLRKCAYLLIWNRVSAQKIIALYRHEYTGLAHLDTLIRISNISDVPSASKSIQPSIEMLDKLIALDVGRAVYSSRFGYGEVAKLDFLLDSLSVNFFTNSMQTITFKQALKSLQLLEPDNFFYLKAKNPSQIKAMFETNREQLLRIMHRDCLSLPKSDELKNLLPGILSDDEIKLLARLLHGSTARVSLRRSEPARAFASALTEIKKLQSESDWQTQFVKLFFSESNRKILQYIITALDAGNKKAVIDRLMLEYRQFPNQFLILLQSAPAQISYTPAAILNRLLDLADDKKYAGAVRKFLIADDFSFLRQLGSGQTPEAPEKIFERLKMLKNFYPEELESIRDIFTEKFPGCFTDQSDYVYHTESAIRRMTAHLQTLLSVEVPKVAQEIAYARGLGDLRENFEFKAAKEKQKRLLAQITQLRHDLTNARAIDFTKIDTSKVSIGTTVKLALIREPATHLTYTILGPWDSDVSKGIISYLAPYAHNLLNKKLGDSLTDAQGEKYKIIEITISV